MREWRSWCIRYALLCHQYWLALLGCGGAGGMWSGWCDDVDCGVDKHEDLNPA